MMFYIFIAISLVVSTEGLYVKEGNDPIVKLPSGTVMGRLMKSYGGRKVLAFEGVPFAKPPVGDLRFKEPQPVEPWTDILLANETYVCVQYIPMLMTQGVSGTEDCLYVYVYVPLQKITGNENLDVVVHIHGGAFMLGAPKFFAGPDYITDKNVIYVSCNYRLGLFGFLSTEDSVVPGNNGLKDQVMALKWIQDNIKYFGGNPNSVTITGLSAGAASVHYHYLSPMSKGLFHRGYSQSGTALNAWALADNPRKRAVSLAAYFNCSTATSQDILDCLQPKPENQLILALTSFFVFIKAIPFAPFGPVIEHGGDSPFLSEHPYKLLSEGKINDVPWVSSNTKNEGIYPVGFFAWYKNFGVIDERWNELMPMILDYYQTVDEDKQAEVSVKLKEHYFGDEKVSLESRYKLVDLCTDRLFLYDSETAIRMHAKVSKSPVYYYLIDYELEMPTVFGPIMKGTAHSDDGRLMFRIVANPLILPPGDKSLMEVFTEFLYLYATTGKPTLKNIEWEPLSAGGDEIKYMQVSSADKIEMKTSKNLVDVDFWNSLAIKENRKLFE